jgi:hypothetical protein
MAVNIKIPVVWCVAPCRLADIFRGTALCIYRVRVLHPEGRGRWFLRNISTKQNYTASHTVLH